MHVGTIPLTPPREFGKVLKACAPPSGSVALPKDRDPATVLSERQVQLRHFAKQRSHM